MSIKLVMPSNHLILCHPLLLLPSILPSIRVFSGNLALRIRWPKHWSFSFSNGPSNEYSGFISFRIDWFDLLSVQGTLKSHLRAWLDKRQLLKPYNKMAIAQSEKMGPRQLWMLGSHWSRTRDDGAAGGRTLGQG